MINLRRAAVVPATMLLAAIASCGDWIRSEREARPLADSALARYAAAVHLPMTAFGAPDVASEGPHLWLFEYRSTTTPERRLVVRVSGRGRVEPSAVPADGAPR